MCFVPACLSLFTLYAGPYLALKKFHPSTIRWDLMHVVHLGLLYVCNGGSMHLGPSALSGEAELIWLVSSHI